MVSADAASGIQALQVAVDRIQQGDAETMLVTAVDLGGEGRNVVRRDSMLPLSRQNHVRPFDASADGSLPGDAAVAWYSSPFPLPAPKGTGFTRSSRGSAAPVVTRRPAVVSARPPIPARCGAVLPGPPS
ncbi:beta-ketoacyl synthase N-terminal-like domain-containing protein [Desulfosarcina cetonica]|uniref:beta-ketoacyl synthase N-terminal-like domain-containing protein n=1 Tax=Desulfosarcina cetonica TaxID=90730 RepID=UPI001C4581FA|nr:beta-ketoacyl synthase N-terminal-like domain-containing protein [Desulfosarcina cetonica]